MVFGETHVVTAEPFLGAEDFAILGKHMPAFFYWLGTGFSGHANAPLHHPNFRVNYDAIPLGSALLAQSALLALKPF